MTRTARKPQTIERPAGRTVDYGPLNDALGYRLRRAQLLVFKGFNETFAAQDIRPAQFSVLVMIGRNPGIRAAEISDALQIKRANLSPFLEDLEKRGIIRRETLPSDRRSQGVFLTADGEKFVADLVDRQRKLEASIDRALGAEDKARLMALLGKLLTVL